MMPGRALSTSGLDLLLPRGPRRAQKRNSNEAACASPLLFRRRASVLAMCRVQALLPLCVEARPRRGPVMIWSLVWAWQKFGRKRLPLSAVDRLCILGLDVP